MKTLRTSLRISLAASVAALLGLVACAPRFGIGDEKKVSVKDVALRHKAPEFALKDNTGKIVHLADYKGKVVLLDFWATWCGPCNIEIPWFTEFEKKYGPRGFEVVGISMDDDGWNAITPFATRKNINYRILLGDETIGDQYGGIEALPTAFVIDRNGKIASVHVGLSPRKNFEDAIEQVL